MHEGHRKRLRERFLATRLEGYAPHEMLELLLTFAIPRRDTNPIAHALLKRFGSLHKVFEASFDDLAAVEGVGENAATLILMLLPMSRKYLQSRDGVRAVLSDARACKAYARSLLMGETVERFYVVALDTKNSVLGQECVAVGDASFAAVSLRKVAEMLLRLGAARCMVCHNHPSGTLTASEADADLTRQLQTLLAPMQITLCDHIIVAGHRTMSLREEAILKV